MVSIDNSGYGKEYLNQISEVFKRMDDKQNGGNGDGKVTVNEAYNDLHIPMLFNRMDKNGEGFQKLQAATAGIENVLQEYAGDDGIFQEEEWANFLNGEEWGQVLNIYHTYKQNTAQTQTNSDRATMMEQVRQSNPTFGDDGTFNTGLTKGMVKVDVIQLAQQAGRGDVDTTKVESVIDQYAGDDGVFTIKELSDLNNNSYFKNFMTSLNNSGKNTQN